MLYINEMEKMVIKVENNLFKMFFLYGKKNDEIKWSETSDILQKKKNYIP